MNICGELNASLAAAHCASELESPLAASRSAVCARARRSNGARGLLRAPPRPVRRATWMTPIPGGSHALGRRDAAALIWQRRRMALATAPPHQPLANLSRALSRSLAGGEGVLSVWPASCVDMPAGVFYCATKCRSSSNARHSDDISYHLCVATREIPASLRASEPALITATMRCRI